MAKQRYVKKQGGTRIWPWSKALSERTDFYECDATGNVLSNQGNMTSEEAVEKLNKAVDRLKADNEALKKVVADQHYHLGIYREYIETNELDDPTIDAPPPPNPDDTDAEDSTLETEGLNREETESSEIATATVEEIVAAIAKLDPHNKEHYTASNMPRVEALEELLPRVSIDSKLRDAAWAEYQNQQ